MPTRIRCARVFGESAHRLGPQPGQRVDIGGVEKAGGVGPGDLQTRVGAYSVDIDHGGQRRPVVLGGLEAARQPRPGGRGAGAGPAQIVEAQLRRGCVRERFGGFGAQVTEHAVADAFVRQRPQLLLDGFDGVARRGVARERGSGIDTGEIDGRRVHAGEPAHGARRIGTR